MNLRRYIPYFGSLVEENADANKTEQKTYHKKATGLALSTVKRHAKENDLKIFGSCFWYAFIRFMSPIMIVYASWFG